MARDVGITARGAEKVRTQMSKSEPRDAGDFGSAPNTLILTFLVALSLTSTACVRPRDTSTTTATPAGTVIPVGVGTPRPGVVDLEIDDTSDATLENLAVREFHTEALRYATRQLVTRLRDDGPKSRTTLQALFRVGMLHYLAGELGTAKLVFDAALDARRLDPKTRREDLLACHLMLGRVARYLQDRAAAEEHFRAADELLAPLRAAHPALAAVSDQFWADWWRAKDPEEAVRRYRAALAQRQAFAGPPTFAEVDVQTWLALTLTMLSRYEESTHLAEDVLAKLENLGLGESSLAGTNYTILGRNASPSGRSSDEETLSCKAWKMVLDARNRLPGGFARSNVNRVDGMRCAAYAAAHGDVQRAWQLTEQLSYVFLSDFIALSAWPNEDPASYAVVERLRRNLLDAERPLNWYLDRGQSAWNPRTRPLLIAMLEARAEIGRLEQQFLAAHSSRTARIDAIQSMLPERTALVEWTESGLATSDGAVEFDGAFVIRRSSPLRSVHFSAGPSSPSSRSVQGRIIDLLVRATTWPGRVEQDEELNANLRLWGHRFIDPLLPYLEGIDTLLIATDVPAIALALLPDQRPLADRFNIVLVPSAASWLELAGRGGNRRRAVTSVVAVAAPSIGTPRDAAAELVSQNTKAFVPQTLVRGAEFTRGKTPLNAVPGLRFAAAEVRAISAMFPRTTVLPLGPRQEATLTQFLADGTLGRADVIHFATHAISDFVPERSALFLSDPGQHAEVGEDGLLDVDEIRLGWRIDPELVTLGGCTTSLMPGASHGAPYGIVNAFFGVGARRVLATLWPVDDQATALLMTRFYENYLGHYKDTRLGYTGRAMTPAEALREATRWLRQYTDARGERPFSHPVYWGGFVIFGS